MLVKELIEKLQKLPDEATVFVLDEEGFEYGDVEVKHEERYKVVGFDYGDGELMYKEKYEVVGIVTDYNNI